MPELRVISPGLLATVQDLGRSGFASLGVPGSGAADALSLRAGNRALGNPDNAAGIEITLTRAEFECLGEARVAIVSGGAIEVRRARADERIVVDPSRAGCRSYLCVAGGVDVPVLMKSRSTCLPGGFGGHEGRALRSGDRLKLGDGPPPREHDLAALALWLREATARPGVRIMRAGRSSEGDGAFDAIVRESFRISPHSDRTGIRLAGGCVHLPQSGRMISEGMPLGAIQVPESGEPIVLMQDRPTTGGYPVVACVAAADIPVLAQRRPGEEVRLSEITLDEARAAWTRQESEFERLLPLRS